RGCATTPRPPDATRSSRPPSSGWRRRCDAAARPRAPRARPTEDAVPQPWRAPRSRPRGYGACSGRPQIHQEGPRMTRIERSARALIATIIAVAVTSGAAIAEPTPEERMELQKIMDLVVGGRNPASNYETTLVNSLTANANTATVISTYQFPANGSLVIDDEEIAYTGRTGTTFTGLLRSQNGTAAAAHAATARVRGPFYKYTTRWAQDEARAKAAAIGDMQYANRLLLSDMLYLNVQRWGEDLQHVGLDLARGWLMYDGNGDLKKRV